MRYSTLLALIVVLLALVPQVSNSSTPLRQGHIVNMSGEPLYWDIQKSSSGSKLIFHTTCAGGHGWFGTTLEDFLYDTFKEIDFGLIWEMVGTPSRLYCGGASLSIYSGASMYSEPTSYSFIIDGLNEGGCNEKIEYCHAQYLLDIAAKHDSILVTNSQRSTQIDLSKLIAFNDLLTSDAVDAHDKSKNKLYKAIAVISSIWIVLLAFSYWFYKRHLKSWFKHALYGLMVIIGLLSIPFIWLYRKVTGRRYNPPSVADELYKLKVLRDSGEISEDEYLLLKHRLLR